MTTTETEVLAETLTDRAGWVWTWDPALHSWCHDGLDANGKRALLLRDRAKLDIEPDPVVTTETEIVEGEATEPRGWFEPAPPQPGGAHHAADPDATQEWTLPPGDEVQAPPEVHGREPVPGGAA